MRGLYQTYVSPEWGQSLSHDCRSWIMHYQQQSSYLEGLGQPSKKVQNSYHWSFFFKITQPLFGWVFQTEDFWLTILHTDVKLVPYIFIYLFTQTNDWLFVMCVCLLVALCDCVQLDDKEKYFKEVLFSHLYVQSRLTIQPKKLHLIFSR